MEDCARKGRSAVGDRHGLRRDPLRASHGDRHYSRARPQDVRRGDKCPWAKIKASDIAAIKSRYAAGESGRRIGPDYGVCHTTVLNIVRGKSWAGYGAGTEAPPKLD